MKKTMSCINSFMPIILIALGFIIMMPTAIFTGTQPEDALLTILMILYFLAAAVVFAGSVWAWVNIIMYIIKTVKNPELSTGMKVLWCILLWFFNCFVFPVYWFMYIKKQY